MNLKANILEILKEFPKKKEDNLFKPRRIEDRVKQKEIFIKKQLEKLKKTFIQGSEEFKNDINDLDSYNKKLRQKDLDNFEKKYLEIKNDLLQQINRLEKVKQTKTSKYQGKENYYKENVVKWVNFYKKIKGGNQFLNFKDISISKFKEEVKKFYNFLLVNKLPVKKSGSNTIIFGKGKFICGELNFYSEVEYVNDKKFNLIQYTPRIYNYEDDEDDEEIEIPINYWEDHDAGGEEQNLYYTIDSITYNDIIRVVIKEFINKRIDFKNFFLGKNEKVDDLKLSTYDYEYGDDEDEDDEDW